MVSNLSLNLETDIQPISDFRSNAATILEQLKKNGRPVVLTQRGKSAAVLLDVRLYQELVDELETLRDIARARAELSSGKGLNLEQAHEIFSSKAQHRRTRNEKSSRTKSDSTPGKAEKS